MAALKDKAKAKSKSKGKLASKAKARSAPPKMEAKTVDEIEREEMVPPAPTVVDPTPVTSAPPLPPTLAYIRKLATIPALRRGLGGQ